MDYLSDFIEFYHNVVRFLPVWKDMERTVENSGWHREANVAVHTDMVVAQYIATPCTQRGGLDWLAGAFACAFHDFGKPAAEEELVSETGTKYRRYAGHELISAREWENFIASPINYVLLQTRFNLSDEDMARLYHQTAYLIEHHLPYQLKDKNKRDALRQTVPTWVLRQVATADCWGRISDDHDTKKLNVREWFEEFCGEESVTNVPLAWSEDAPELVVLVGASGTGKSTFARTHYPNHSYYSWDEIRVRHYTSDVEQSSLSPSDLYNLAFERSVDDSAFNGVVMREFSALMKAQKSVVVDNTNVSVKRRKVFIQDAKKRGYRVRVVLFPIDVASLRTHTHGRADKNIPESVATSMWSRIQMPSKSEYDVLTVKFEYKSPVDL